MGGERFFAMINPFTPATTRVYTNDSDAIILTLYSIFAAYHCYNRGKVYRPPHRALTAHICSGTVEVILYYSGWQCSLPAVVACLVQSITSLMLVKRLHNGYPPHTRPAYQAGSFLRLVRIVQAYVTKDAMDYHDVIMLLHGFVYTRALLFIFGIMGRFSSLKENINLRESYDKAVMCAAMISVSHCSSPWAVAEYLAVFSLVGVLSRWASKMSKKEMNEGSLKAFVNLLRTIGMHLIETEEKPPQIGNLRADRVGSLIMEYIP